MIIMEKVSPVTGKSNTMAINATPEQVEAWVNGTLIQDAMPNASVDEREFCIARCDPQCWHSLHIASED